MSNDAPIRPISIAVCLVLAWLIPCSATASPKPHKDANGFTQIKSEQPQDHTNEFPLPPGPAFGLGDYGGVFEKLDLTGIDTGPILNDGGRRKHRFLSTFVIWPRGGRPAPAGDGARTALAKAVFDTTAPQVSLQNGIAKFTATNTTEAVFWSAEGTVEEVYAAWKRARTEMGYPGVAPNATWFQLGWESWDALRWDTNAKTVRETLVRWREMDFPIRWVVTGSGFWAPRQTTLSFGAWHADKYPDPAGFRKWLLERDMVWIIGGRTNFVLGPAPVPANTPEGQHWLYELDRSPLTDLVMQRGFLYHDDQGSLYKVRSSAFPRTDCALLDGRQAAAAEWFAEQWSRWQVDGIKEDTMMPTPEAALYNAPMRALVEDGQLVMARNAVFSSPGTLARIEDMHTIDAMTDRVARNFQQLAASAAPNAYVDTVGFAGVNSNPIGTLRHAWFSALTAGMSVGALPTNWKTEHLNALRKAAHFHVKLAPYLYDAAWRSHESGFPYTMTPLPIAFPEDDEIARLAGLADSPLTHQWMVSEALLATPLAHAEYRERNDRSVYLPAGRWIDLTTGQLQVGPKLIEHWPVALDAVPAFAGGPGVLLFEPTEGNYVCQVFPTVTGEQPAKVEFRLPDGVTISVSNAPDWKQPSVKELHPNANRTPAKATPLVPGGIAFQVVPGGRYAVVAQ